MTINQLMYFIAIVEKQNFLDAAESLNLSQSSLSKSIKRLEDELNLKLFDRSKRSAFLTPEGEVFYEGSLKTVNAHQETLLALSKKAAAAHSSIRLISLPFLSQYQLMHRLRSFSNENPQIELIIDEMEDVSLWNELANGTCDLAITRQELLKSENCIFHPMTTDVLVALLPLSHPLARRKSLHLYELKDESFILMNKYISIYSSCINACKESGFAPNVIRTARVESILGAVRAGEGISLLMQQSLEVFNYENIAIIPLEEVVSSTVVVALPLKKKQTKSSKALLQKLLANP